MMREDEIEELVLEMKNTSELMVDLAYSALLYDIKAIADEVFELEDRVDDMYGELERGVLELHKADVITEDRALAYLRLGNATELIADSAIEIADVVARDVELHPIIRMSVRESDVLLDRVPVDPGAPLDGRTLGEAHVARETGMRIIAIRRGNHYLYGPSKSTRVHGEDVLFARGPKGGPEKLRNLARNPTLKRDEDEDAPGD